MCGSSYRGVSIMKKKKRGKLGVRLFWGLILFAIMITLLITIVTSFWVWGSEVADLSTMVVGFARVASTFIKSDTIEKYYKEGTTDEYYDEVQVFLTSQAESFGLEYYYIFVPEENRIVYIWDSGNKAHVSALGDTEPYDSPREKEIIMGEYSGNPTGTATYSSVYDKYGDLLTAYYPILKDNNEPVAMVGVDINKDEFVDKLVSLFCIIVISVSIVTIIMMIIFYIGISRGLVHPIRTLHRATTELITNLGDDPEKAKEFHVDVHTNDELEDLADAFTQMDHDLKDYVVRLEKVTREKEKISAELNVAAEIQEDMLPRTFPPFPDHHEFEIYASMDPAREVGGDFYDFFLIDEDHLCLVIADVSDKGVPASLFMVISKTLLQLRAMMGGTTSEIFYDVNNRLCDGNDAELFVTVWMAIVDLKTGKGIVSNAGHEHPVLRRKGGSFELIQYKHGPALAVMPNVKFEEHTFELHPGDTLFVYTDGAVEASNLEKKLFGTGRLVDTLNTVENTDPKQMISSVSKAIEEFVGTAPQFDDTTMLAFSYYGPEGNSEENAG